MHACYLLLEHLLCREGMTQEEAERLVTDALALAMARDGSSGIFQSPPIAGSEASDPTAAFL